MSREIEELERIARRERATAWRHACMLPARASESASALTRKHPFWVTAGASALGFLLVRRLAGKRQPRRARAARTLAPESRERDDGLERGAAHRSNGAPASSATGGASSLVAAAFAFGLRTLPGLLRVLGESTARAPLRREASNGSAAPPVAPETERARASAPNASDLGRESP